MDFKSYLTLDRGLAHNTIVSYISDCKNTQEELRKVLQKSLLTMTANDLRTLWDHLTTTQNLSARSRARKLSALRLYYQFLVQQGTLTQSPLTGLETPSLPQRLPHTLSTKEIENLLASPHTKAGDLAPPLRARDHLMLRFLYATGLRVTELVTLPLHALDTESGLIRVTGKGGKTRLIPLDPGTITLLTNYITHIRPIHAASAPSTAALFLTRRGQSFTRQGFWLLIKQYAKAVGIHPLPSPHTLRHAFATHLMQRGMGLRTLQMLLGHSDIATTEIYSHVSPDHLKETIARYHPRLRRE